jgi:signal transduction histidine kinase
LNRAARFWVLLALFAALGLGAMAWITRTALRMEQAETQSRKQAFLQSQVRLALWRMDSTLSPVVTLESARPYFHFSSFYAPDRAFNRMFATQETGGIQIPSPLLLGDEPHILLHFQVDPRDEFSSPMAPGAGQRPAAVKAGADPERMDAASTRLNEIKGVLNREKIRVAMFQQGAILQTLEQLQSQGPLKGQDPKTPVFVYQSPFTPFWCGDRLLLGRQVWVGDQEYFQGCWLDWPLIRSTALSTILDVLPGADLVPPDDRHPKGRLLATLPIRLLSGDLPPEPRKPWSPVRLALIFGWTCAVLAGVAGTLVLLRAVQLSERQGTFVSAVTHELRTPLTTFRLYTEMLAMGMVPNEEERQSFLTTLLVEADRLDHLVKNVLSFARLEARRSYANRDPIALEDLLDRQSGRLYQRSKQAGMALHIEVPEPHRRLQIHTDPSVVEQILFNLVDNACKYALSGPEPSVRITVERRKDRALLRCQDSGSGIPTEDRKHLFKAFHKSAQKAARSAPGVGLGLALCRRLARSLGGDLVYEASVQGGACFILELPLAPPPAPSS